MTKENNDLLSKIKEYATLGNLLISLAIVVFGFFLNKKQNDLENKFKKEQVIQNFADQITKNLGNLSLDQKAQRDVVIALLDIVTEANLREGEVDEKYREEIPLRIALVSDSPEMLAHIGGDSLSTTIWIGIAQKSNNSSIKRTAIEALTHISENSNDVKVLKSSISSIMDLSGEVTSRDLDTITINSLYSITNRIIDNELLFFRTDFEQEFEQLAIALNALKSSPNYSTISTLPSYDSLARYAGISEADVVEMQDSRLESIPMSDSEKYKIDSLIRQLDSDDADTRRKARNLLALKGQEAVGIMMDTLTEEVSYRIKLGAVYAMLIMKNPPNLQHQNVQDLVQLLGDRDPTIRKYTAQLLVRISDPDSRSDLFSELCNKLKRKDNANLVYNGVVVIGDWIGMTDDQDIKQSYIDCIIDLKEQLQEEEGTWSYTIGKIDESIDGQYGYSLTE